jgi:hypothetical protein
MSVIAVPPSLVDLRQAGVKGAGSKPMILRSDLDDRLEPAPEHPLAVDGMDLGSMRSRPLQKPKR